MTSIDLRPVRHAAAVSLDPVEAAGVRYTTPPTFGDSVSEARYLLQQRELEERATYEFVVSRRCSVTSQDGRRYDEGEAITPSQVHADVARGRAALQTLATRGVIVWTAAEQITANKAKARR